MNIPEPQYDNFCAVIITYNPDKSFLDHFKSEQEQIKFTIIVDNGSSRGKEFLIGISKNKQKVHLIKNQQNKGIAAALNQGIRAASERGFKWYLLLDQDSYLKEKGLSAFINIYSNSNLPKNIGLVGSNHIDNNSHEYYLDPNKYKNSQWIERKTLITSGIFIPIEIFNFIGPFNEGFFLDGVDHEYSLRVRKKGFKNIIILKPLLEHSMGNRVQHYFLGLPFLKTYSTNYAPIRWYWATRNRLILVWDYFLFDCIWSVTSFIRFLGSVGIMCLYEKERGKKIKYIWKGIKDSWKKDFRNDVK